MLPALTRRRCARWIALAAVPSLFAPSSAALPGGLALAVPDGAGLVHLDGHAWLVGEAIVENRDAVPRLLTRLTVHDGDAVLAEVAGTALLATMADEQGRPARATRLAPGARGVLYLWIRLARPASTSVQLAVHAADDVDGTVGPRVTRSAVVAPLQPPSALQPPLRGGPWVALFDPQFPFGHRRSVFVQGDERFIPARYAIDWMRVDERGRPAPGALERFAEWHGLGAEVLAVADGEIALVRDGQVDVLGAAQRGGTWRPDEVAGNVVALRIARDRFVFYEHLAQGSVQVRVGDRVRAGQGLGRVGRSGVNSTGPHLHLHVADRPSLLHAQGRPFGLSGWTLQGRYASMDEAEAGGAWRPEETTRAPLQGSSLPPANAVVVFDGPASVRK